MSENIFDVISDLKCVRFLSPACESDISNAEKKMGIRFAEEYKKYTMVYGAIYNKEFEITGVCDSPKMDVMAVTLHKRLKDPNFPGDMYVVEDTGAEDLLVLQNQEGKIFSYIPELPPQQMFDSMAEFLEDFYGQKRKPIHFI